MNQTTKLHTQSCIVCQKNFSPRDITPYSLVTNNVSLVIKLSHSQWDEGKYICHTDLNHFRSEYIATSISQDKSELTEIEQSVLQSLKQHEAISKNVNDAYQEETTVGDRFADKIAEFGGSWKFIIIFFTILAIWIIINSISFFNNSYDPYPFILLNLILSCLASIQAPIIMMSQNRQAAKDRLRAEMDYKVNLKAELEIRHLKTKLDQLSSHQWQRLLEIQQLQTQLIQELANK